MSINEAYRVSCEIHFLHGHVRVVQSYLHRHRLSYPTHVRDGCHVLWPGDADLKRGFQRWLVETWKSASRICRLKLRRGDPSVTEGTRLTIK